MVVTDGRTVVQQPSLASWTGHELGANSCAALFMGPPLTAEIEYQTQTNEMWLLSRMDSYLSQTRWESCIIKDLLSVNRYIYIEE